MVEPPTGPAPWLVVVSLTVIAAPAPAVAGTVNTDITRSPPTCTTVELTLLVSVVSPTTPSASARASRNQAPVAVPAGIVTTVVPAWLAPAPRAGTARAPSAASPASRTTSADR